MNATMMHMLTATDILASRKALGLKQREFAARLKVSLNTVQRWELGDRHPRWETMREINRLAEEVRAKAVPAG
jgi:DNA-binding transcriptional regulator YiaG